MKKPPGRHSLEKEFPSGLLRPKARGAMRGSFDGQEILLVRLGGFGDVIFTLPAVHVLRASFPTARITFLVYKEFASVLEGFPGIHTVLTIDRAAYRRFNPIRISADTLALVKRLVGGRFKLVVDFQGFGETGLLTWLTGAPERWGSVYRQNRKWAYTRPVWRNRQLHAVDYHLDLLHLGGGLKPPRVC